MRKKEKIIGAIVIAVIAAVFILAGYLNSSSKKISKQDMESMFVDDDGASTKSEKKSSDKDSTSYRSLSQKDESSDSCNTQLVLNVEIKGEVKKPDVYQMDNGSIVNDLIRKSGGAKSDADMSSINRAAKLSDNQCIVIPKKGDKNTTVPGSNIGGNSLNPASSADTSSELVNINSADKEGLKKLSGIGDSKAQKIIDYRTEHGQFKNIDEIKNVSGIGESTFNNLKNKITVK